MTPKMEGKKLKTKKMAIRKKFKGEKKKKSELL